MNLVRSLANLLSLSELWFPLKKVSCFLLGLTCCLIFNFYNIAGVIIGKGGKNVAELREQTNCKAGVSKVVAGVHERVLTITGTVQGVAKVST